MVDVNKEKDISVLAGVPYPTPRAFRASRAPGLFLSPYCHIHWTCFPQEVTQNSFHRTQRMRISVIQAAVHCK